jgi:hypothetical protein
MKISFEPLFPYNDDVRDGFIWWKTIEAWSVDYEKRCMVPDEDNHTTAEETTALLLYDAPESVIPAGKQVVWALMDERLRRAMLYPDPPRALEWIIDKSLQLRGYLIRYFFLPRPWAFRKQKVGEKDPNTGALHATEYVAEPWYVKPSLLNLWGPIALWRRLTGKPLPGPKFQGQGYVIREVGPPAYRNLGQKEQDKNEAHLRSMDRMGCPFR